MSIATEAEWLACGDPRSLARFCKNRNDQVRFRWLLVRWGECVRHLLAEDEAEFFAAFAEWATIGGTSPRFARNVRAYLSRLGETAYDAAQVFVGELSRHWLVYAAAGAAVAAARISGPLHDQTARQFCDEFRDVAGNPYRRVEFDPAWRTETVVGLTAGIDETGAYERLPILADALEEAGCDDEDILAHCREPGVHVRGCWLVDKILGR